MNIKTIEHLFNKITIKNDTSLDDNVRLLYYCGKIELILQEILDHQDDIKDGVLAFKYSDLLEYCFKALKEENIDFNVIFNNPQEEYILPDTAIYSLMEYSIKKFENPRIKIYNDEFIGIIKNIIQEIAASKVFTNIINHTKWI